MIGKDAYVMGTYACTWYAIIRCWQNTGRRAFTTRLLIVVVVVVVLTLTAVRRLQHACCRTKGVGAQTRYYDVFSWTFYWHTSKIHLKPPSLPPCLPACLPLDQTYQALLYWYCTWHLVLLSCR